jgi:hypothetical protein
MHTNCVNVICGVMLGQDKGRVDDNTNIHDEGKDARGRVVDDNVQETTNAAMEDPLHCDQVVNNRNQDEQDEPDAQHADDTVQQTSNTAMDEQA